VSQRNRILIAVVCPLLATTAALVRGDEGKGRKAVERGELLYRIYCQNCHGKQGHGDGPTAAVLTVRPADLGRLKKEGEFPRDEIRGIIDGRETARGHGDAPREMPIWGLGFQELDRDADQEAEVRAKIEALLDFLETIQRP